VYHGSIGCSATADILAPPPNVTTSENPGYGTEFFSRLV
jgi:hypothetical protein